MRAQVTYSIEHGGATYVRLEDEPVARTVSVSDLVLVDVDVDDRPVGVDFATAPDNITDLMISRVTDRFPVLKELGVRETWLYAHS